LYVTLLRSQGNSNHCRHLWQNLAHVNDPSVSAFEKYLFWKKNYHLSFIFKWKKISDFTNIADLVVSGLYYKHILTIVSDDRKWSLYYECAYDRNWALASVINYGRKGCYNLEHHLLMTLGASITIVIRL
jgi:hypothetical protein